MSALGAHTDEYADLGAGDSPSGARNLRFFVNRAVVGDKDGHAGEIDIAADAGEDALTPKSSGIRLRRLPFDLPTVRGNENVTVDDTNYSIMAGADDTVAEEPELFTRPEGSLEARALGTAVHALFEKATRLLAAGTSMKQLRADIQGWKGHAAAILRNSGVVEARGGQTGSGTAQGPLSTRAMDAVRAALDDPMGQWILGPHADAQTETAWTGLLDGALRTLRVDRTFRAACEPLSDGDECLWIIDYKTASESAAGADDFLKAQRLKYEKQLEMYGKMLRLARGSSLELRLGLYYPFMKRLDYWSLK